MKWPHYQQRQKHLRFAFKLALNLHKPGEECFTACLQEPDVQARVNCIKVLNDCAGICLEAVQYMARNSQFAKALCQVCATICDACAKECEMFKDTHCQECARIYRECAEECVKWHLSTRKNNRGRHPCHYLVLAQYNCLFDIYLSLIRYCIKVTKHVTMHIRRLGRTLPGWI